MPGRRARTAVDRGPSLLLGAGARYWEETGRICYNNAMETPKLRWIEAVPFSRDGEDMILLRDTEGISEQTLVVSRPTAFLLSLMDGTRSLREIQADYMRMGGDLIYMEQLEELVRAMDEHLLLDNERFRAYLDQLVKEYREAPVRLPQLAGRGYPSNGYELARFLDEMMAPRPAPITDGPVAGVLAPHIDYQRGKAVYRSTYGALRGIDNGTLLVLIGTCHHHTDLLCNISLKDFATPFGVLKTPGDLAARIREHPALKACIHEWPHRNEHSIELQLPLLQFVTGNEDLEILCILTGSMHEWIEGRRDLHDGELGDILGGLKDLLNGLGRPYTIVSGADLAHIGAQFGDAEPLSAIVLERSRLRDHEVLRRIEAVDGDTFFQVIKDEGDSRRICGLAPIYFQLRLLGGSRCTLTGYEQWSDGASSVSFAGAIFTPSTG